MTEITIGKLIKALIVKKQDLIRLQKYEQTHHIRSAIKELEAYVGLAKPRKTGR